VALKKIKGLKLIPRQQETLRDVFLRKEILHIEYAMYMSIFKKKQEIPHGWAFF
jgi:hypothetical protein